MVSYPPLCKKDQTIIVHPLEALSIPVVAQPKTYTLPQSHLWSQTGYTASAWKYKTSTCDLSIILPGGWWWRSWEERTLRSRMLKSNRKHNMIEQSRDLRARIDIEVYEQTQLDVIVHKDRLSDTLASISHGILYESEEWNSLIEYQRTEIEQSQEDILSSILHSKYDLYPKHHPLHRLARGSTSSAQDLKWRDKSKHKTTNPKHWILGRRWYQYHLF